MTPGWLAPVLTASAIVTAFAVLMAATLYIQKEALQLEVRTACQGVIAELDLTEFVRLCRNAK